MAFAKKLLWVWQISGNPISCLHTAVERLYDYTNIIHSFINNQLSTTAFNLILIQYNCHHQNCNPFMLLTFMLSYTHTYTVYERFHFDVAEGISSFEYKSSRFALHVISPPSTSTSSPGSPLLPRCASTWRSSCWPSAWHRQQSLTRHSTTMPLTNWSRVTSKLFNITNLYNYLIY